MKFGKMAVFLFLVMISGSVTALPLIENTTPGNKASVENQVRFQFEPECDLSCSSASLKFNTTGNLSFDWTTDNWHGGEKSGVKASGGNLSLSSPGVLGKLNYEWYETGGYYDSNNHPASESGLDEFFDASNDGVSLGGEGDFERRIHWHDNQFDSKPSYLPSENYSWKASGYLYVPELGTYTIGIDSDDSADVIIDGVNVASWYGGHGIENGYSHNGDITLDKGQHKIALRMEEGFGQDGVSLAWQKPGESSFSVIPADRFSNDSIKYNSSGSYETEVKRLKNPIKWTEVSKTADIPVNTSIDLDFAVKKGGVWKYYDNLSDVPETKNLKANVSLNTQENYSTPELDSLTLEYSTPANSNFSWVESSNEEFEEGFFTNMTASGDSIELSENATGTQGSLQYRWYDTSGLNQDNEYAEDEEEMDKFMDGSVAGVSLGGRGLHSREVHWHSGQWDSKPSYLPSGEYSWEATGYIYAPSSGTYTIGIDSDDASDVFVAGSKVASYYGPHGTSGGYGNNGDISLSQGFHTIKVRMQEYRGGDGVSLAWQKPGDSSFTVIPANRLYPRSYHSSGNYTSGVFRAMEEVDWKASEISSSTPLGTSYDINFATNKSGNWVYNDSLGTVPDSQYLKYRAHLETTDGDKTPSIEKVNITYANTETSFRTMKTVNDVESGETNNLTYDFSSYSLPTNFEWDIDVEQGDGATNTSDRKIVKVEEKSFPKPDIEWYEPEDGDENRTPINYTFRPTCYSEYGCYEVGVHFNSTGQKGSWIYDTDADWTANGSSENLSHEDGSLKLDGKVGVQGELQYYWYDTEGLNQNNQYASSESDMDEFFNPDISGVSLGGKGTHSDQVHWSNSGAFGPKPGYLPGDHYSWKAQGYINAPVSGTYTIGIDSDDASDVMINGEKVASYYGGHAPSGSYSNQGTISLSSGYHPIKVRMQENTGGDGVSLAWQKPGDSSFTVIPANRFYRRDFESTGIYTSQILSIGKKINLKDVSVSRDVPSGTSMDIDYLENSSGTWQSHDSVGEVPETEQLQMEVDMSTSSEKTPRIERINLSYEDREVFKKRLSKEDVYNRTSDMISSKFLNHSLPQAFRTVLSVKQSNGQVTKTSPRTVKVKFSGIKTTISWNDTAENEIGYKISTNASGTWKNVGKTGRNSEEFQDRNPNLKDGDYACYRVKAYNMAGESPPLEGCTRFTAE